MHIVVSFDFDFYHLRVNKDILYKAYSYWLSGFADTIHTFTCPEQKEIVYIFIGRLEVH